MRQAAARAVAAESAPSLRSSSSFPRRRETRLVPESWINVARQWSGRWQSVANPGFFGQLSASLGQSGVAMSGTVTFSGSPCLTGGNVSGTEIANLKGGSSTPKNLRILCAKCNTKRGARI